MYEGIFWVQKYSSVTNMLLELGLPTFNTVICNSFESRSANVINSIVELFEC